MGSDFAESGLNESDLVGTIGGRGDSKGGLGCGDGFVELTVLGVGEGKIIENVEVVGVSLDGSLIVFDGLVDSVGGHEQVAHVGIMAGVIGPEAKGVGEMLFGFVKLVSLGE